MSIRNSYRCTLAATYIGHITQAIVNGFAPLLFVLFKETLGISNTETVILIAINFGVQLVVDLLCAGFMDRFGYRIPIVSAQAFAAVGFVGLGVFPTYLFPSDPFIGLALATVLYAIGGGLTEVLISPIVQACPTENKQAHMKLLHSFYCWGSVLVILGTALFNAFVGEENWRILSAAWAVVPIIAAVLFAFAPLNRLNDGVPSEERISFTGLFKKPLFWLFIVMMACSGACEQAMYQSAAYLGDRMGFSDIVVTLVGPCMFVMGMGISRIITARMAKRIASETIMMACCGLCAGAYVIAAFAPMLPVLMLVGFGLCGLAIGIFWPGTFSFASDCLRGGGTALFALLALGGDLGGTGGGPAIKALADIDITGAMLFATVFPIGLMLCVLLLKRAKRNK